MYFYIMAGQFNFKIDTSKFANEMRAELEAKLTAVDVLLKQELRNAVIDAVNRAPGDEGVLRAEIGFKGQDLNYEFVAAAFYSVYMEFGTGPKAMKGVKPGYETLARETATAAKGTNAGSWAQFVLAMAEWARRSGYFTLRKGQTWDQVGLAIARKIYRQGLEPRPFMIPAWEKFVEQFTTKLNNIK